MGPSLVLIFRLAALLPLVCMSNLTIDGVIFMKTCLSTYLFSNFLSSGIIPLHNNKAPSYPLPSEQGYKLPSSWKHFGLSKHIFHLQLTQQYRHHINKMLMLRLITFYFYFIVFTMFNY